MSIYIGDKEIKNLYTGGSTSVSDMQGPCPDGFHIPQSSERTNIFNAGESIGAWNLSGDSNAKNRKIINYLKLPTHGGRSGSDGSASTSQSNGYYASPIWYDSSNCYVLRISRDSNYLDASSTNRFTNGTNIRPFRNEPVVPNSSWTVLYQGTGTAGIYHNSTLGLISISSNGTTRYTIADKNLGATTTFDAWDATQTAENCGGQFQWGNNYMFPFSGSVTTSTTQVDASNYGPGNYYSDSTFRRRTYSPYSWDTSGNKNLRGGVSQGTIEKSNVKAVYLGENKVRPAYKPRTFTISWTEQSNMSSGWTYSDDAAGLTAGDTAFDEFFGYYGCRLNTSGVETAKITQEESGGAGKLDITQLGTLTSGDNVMIAFPVRGIKMTKSGSKVTLSITKELNKDGYQYYAFQTGTLSNPGTAKDQFYLGAYKGYTSSSKLKSWSGQSPTANTSYTNFCTYAKNNGTGYNIAGYYQRMYIQALYMMKYGNPDGRATVGYGTSSGSKLSTGGTNSLTNATASASTNQIKLFGLEDRYGNLKEIIGGAYSIYSGGCKLYAQLSNWNGTLSGGEDTGTTLINKYGWNISGIAGTNKGMFAPTVAVNNSSYNTYYCGEVYVSQSTVWATSGGAYNEGINVRLFRTDFMYTTDYNAQIGARLMYL